MALYSYRCPECGYPRVVNESIEEHGTNPPPICPSCTLVLKRDYREDKPQPAPMWPEHMNPSTGTVVRSRRQLQDDMDRGAAELFDRTGIESRPVVVDHADLPSMRPELA